MQRVRRPHAFPTVGGHVEVASLTRRVPGAVQRGHGCTVRTRPEGGRQALFVQQVTCNRLSTISYNNYSR